MTRWRRVWPETSSRLRETPVTAATAKATSTVICEAENDERTRRDQGGPEHHGHEAAASHERERRDRTQHGARAVCRRQIAGTGLADPERPDREDRRRARRTRRPSGMSPRARSRPLWVHSPAPARGRPRRADAAGRLRARRRPCGSGGTRSRSGHTRIVARSTQAAPAAYTAPGVETARISPAQAGARTRPTLRIQPVTAFSATSWPAVRAIPGDTTA